MSGLDKGGINIVEVDTVGPCSKADDKAKGTFGIETDVGRGGSKIGVRVGEVASAPNDSSPFLLTTKDPLASKAAINCSSDKLSAIM